MFLKIMHVNNKKSSSNNKQSTTLKLQNKSYRFVTMIAQLLQHLPKNF